MLEQRNDVDTAAFEHRAIGKIEPVHGVALELVLDPDPGAGQETRGDPVRHRTEAQVDAGRLDLVFRDRRVGLDAMMCDQVAGCSGWRGCPWC